MRIKRHKCLHPFSSLLIADNGASDAQASVYLWVAVAIGVYVRAQVGKPGYCLYCLIVNMDCSWSNSSSNISDIQQTYTRYTLD